MTLRSLSSTASIVAATLAMTGCPNPEDVTPPPNPQEVITTVTLTFTPDGGGAEMVFSHADPENDGSPVVDAIELAADENYDLTVKFINELAEPAEDITEEVDGESDEHQIFVYGSGVEGPATKPNANKLVTIAYADTDANSLPIGLTNTVVTDATGTAELKIMLRHLPPEDGTAVKAEGLAADFAEGGTTAIGGDVDVDLTFPLTVE